MGDKPLFSYGFYATNGAGAVVWQSNDGQKIALHQHSDEDSAALNALALNERAEQSIHDYSRLAKLQTFLDFPIPREFISEQVAHNLSLERISLPATFRQVLETASEQGILLCPECDRLMDGVEPTAEDPVCSTCYKNREESIK